jgi:hypothetical protein
VQVLQELVLEPASVQEVVLPVQEVVLEPASVQEQVLIRVQVKSVYRQELESVH